MRCRKVRAGSSIRAGLKQGWDSKEFFRLRAAPFQRCFPSRCEGVDGADELVEVGDRSVDVRRYADAADVLPHNADGVDLVLVEEGAVEVAGRHAIDGYAADGAGVFGVERGVELDLRDWLHARGPVVFQVADALFLAAGADAFVEVDGFADALLDGEAARAEVLRICGCRRCAGWSCR